MSDSGATLPDMLAMVPALLKTCTPRAFDTSMAVALRLVCKELSVTMTRVMWRCTVQLGEGACPTIGQVVRVMQLAKLRLLTVTVSTTSGGALRPQHTQDRHLQSLFVRVAKNGVWVLELVSSIVMYLRHASSALSQ